MDWNAAATRTAVPVATLPDGSGSVVARHAHADCLTGVMQSAIAGYSSQGNLFSGTGYWARQGDMPTQLTDHIVRLPTAALSPSDLHELLAHRFASATHRTAVYACLTTGTYSVTALGSVLRTFPPIVVIGQTRTRTPVLAGCDSWQRHVHHRRRQLELGAGRKQPVGLRPRLAGDPRCTLVLNPTFDTVL